jgi:hypothetical protein
MVSFLRRAFEIRIIHPQSSFVVKKFVLCTPEF